MGETLADRWGGTGDGDRGETMDAIVMCGGRGTRLGLDVEKPLLEIGGVAMIDRVLGALAESDVDDRYAVGSPAVPDTATHIRERYGAAESGSGSASPADHTTVEYIEAAGEGYVADLSTALERVETPVLTIAADLPLLAGDAIDSVLAAYERGSMTVCVPTERKRALGVTIDSTTDDDGTTVTPTGVNVVGDPEPETIFMTTDTRFAVNVNRPRDAWVAEVLR